MRTALSVLALVLFAACDPQKPNYGFDQITKMTTPPDDPALTCGVVIPPDRQGDAKKACAFATGARTGDTLGISAELASTIPIQHVIVVMKENRSFDQILGQLHDRGQPGTEAIPADFVNLDLNGTPVAPHHADTTCTPFDPGHQSQSMRAVLNGGKMDGFVTNAARTTGSDGHWAMEYFDESDLPFYYFLAKTYALNDRHFAAMDTGTYANRNMMMFGTNAGAWDTGIVYPPPNTPSLIQLLMNAGYTWGSYTFDLPFSGSLDMTMKDPGVHTMQDLYDALDQGTLPNVAFVDARDSIDDDHPPADLQKGEAWTKAIYDHAVKSPQWGRTAIIWTYDEAGGLFDHVPPSEKTCAPSKREPFVDRGTRVPFVMISPWAKRNYVSHTVQDHMAITRFIETLFGLPALTPRDANATALFDLLDFSCPENLTVPPAPAAGTGGCANPP